MVEGPQTGRKFKVGDVAVIGRSADVHVQIEDAGVSRNHARLQRTDMGGYQLEDLGSKNGTLVNGVPVQRRVLVFGDKVQLGPRVLLLFTPYDPVEDQILQRQQLEGLGRLGAGIAHDLNNMLGAIGASVEFLTKLKPTLELSTPEVRECIDDIQLAVAQASDLTRAILRFARGKTAGHTVVNISALSIEVVRLVRHTFDRAIQIEPQIQAGLAVYGDQAELHQVLMNLCLNARDAMPHGGMLRISAKLVPAESGKTHDDILITVQDTGTGMDTVTRSRMFEPFFTTKREGAGYGLGLATVRDVVQYHGGEIDVDSSPGKGSIFQLRLPATTDKPLSARTHDMPDTLFGPSARASRGCTVLLVDDEEIVRRSLSRLLKQAGHHVTEASSGRQAIGIYSQLSPLPDVVILDLDMPELSGEQTRDLILQRNPLAKVIFVSGHDDARGEAAGQSRGTVEFLRKPCTVQALLEAVDRAVMEPLEYEDEWTSAK
jgi:signal transduction histidine kinase/ActR/RegA family two-component response regulator